jgi:glycosyltransferase involved in cell wall biosynthesis
MRIVHVSIADTHGGAARAAYRLHVALRERGNDSCMFVMRKLTHDPDVVAFQPESSAFLPRAIRRLRRARIRSAFALYRRTRPDGAWLFSDARTEHAAAVVRQLPTGDVLNLHAIAGFVDHEHFFPNLPAGVPIVWRLPEMSPFTGGCHQDEGCGRFAMRCGACPQLGSKSRHDLSHRIWRRKARSLRPLVEAGRIHLVAPSEWIAGQARRSSLLGDCPVTVVPNGLDTEQWRPLDRGVARAALGLPGDARIVLFAAASTQNRLKGLHFAAEAVASLRERVTGLMLATVGFNEPAAPGGVPLVHLGALQSDRLLRLAYAAADVFVMPSLHESFGQTAVEAMACGVPVVGFAAGGIAETVRDGQTGYLAPVGDVGALRASLEGVLLDDALRKRMGESARALAVSEYDAALQAARFESLYRCLMGQVAARLPGSPMEKTHVCVDHA